MKKIIPFIILLLSGMHAFAQCVPDQTLTLVGFYPPDSLLPCVEDSVYYDEVIQFKNFSYIDGANVGFPGFIFTVNWVSIDSIHNLPAGLSYNCNTANCYYTTGETGCVNVTGTTNAPAGDYYLGFFATVDLSYNGNHFTTAHADSALLASNGLAYKLTVISHGDTCPNDIYVPPVCFPDPNLTQIGFYPPDSLLDCVEDGAYYDEVIQFKNFDVIPGNIIGFPGFTFTILSVQLDSVRNVPDGITYACSSSNCYFAGGEIGCVRMSGITYAPPGDYPLGFYATVVVDLGTGSPFTINADSTFLANAGLGYKLTVIGAGTICPNTFVAGPLTVHASSPPVACDGDTIPLSASINGGAGPYSFVWSPGSNLSNPSLPNPQLYPSNPGTYSVTVTDNNGSTSSGNVTVQYTAGPTVTVSNDTSICAGEVAQLSAYGGSSFIWQPSSGLSATNIQNPTASPSSTTIYTVIVSDGSCTNTADVIVTVDTSSPATHFTFIKNGFTVAFLNSTTNGESYHWDFGDGSTSTEQNPNHQYLQQLVFTVTLVATSKCGTEDTFTSTVDMSVGISSIQNEDLIRIYPNPGNGFYQINSKNPLAGDIEMEVFALHGEKILVKTISGDKENFQLDLSNQPKGIYFLKITQRQNAVIKKLVIQ